MRIWIEDVAGGADFVPLLWKVVGTVVSMKRVASVRMAVTKADRDGREVAAPFWAPVGFAASRAGWAGRSSVVRGINRTRFPNSVAGDVMLVVDDVILVVYAQRKNETIYYY